MSTEQARTVGDRVRENVGAVAAVLAVVSIGLVFAAAGGVIPSRVFPRAPGVIKVVPHLNAVISVVAIVAIADGVRAIRRGNVVAHRRRMFFAFVFFLAFLVLYFYKVILAGPSPFPGPEGVYTFVYLPLLAIHIVLAVVCIPLLYYVLLLAVTHEPAELPSTNHRRVGRVAASLWLVSFALGIVVYVLLYVAY